MKASSAPFVLELSAVPLAYAALAGASSLRSRQAFVKKAGTIILACTFAAERAAVLRQLLVKSSVIGHIGHFIEPVIHPLGFDWKIGIGPLSLIVAREVIVGTLGTLYGVDPATHAASLQSALHHDLSIGGAIALVVFFAFAMQCTSTIAVVRRETNS